MGCVSHHAFLHINTAAGVDGKDGLVLPLLLICKCFRGVWVIKYIVVFAHGIHLYAMTFEEGGAMHAAGNAHTLVSLLCGDQALALAKRG